MLEDTKDIIRSRNSWKNRIYNGQKLEGTKDLIGSRNSKERQYSGQKKKDKITNTMTEKTLHRKLKFFSRKDLVT